MEVEGDGMEGVIVWFHRDYCNGVMWDRIILKEKGWIMEWEKVKLKNWWWWVRVTLRDSGSCRRSIVGPLSHHANHK